MKQSDIQLESSSSSTASLGKYDKKRRSDTKKKSRQLGIILVSFLCFFFLLVTRKEGGAAIPKPQPILTARTNQVLPNVLLVGAQKAGSTALAEWIFQNGVCRPKYFGGEPALPYNKEVHFFDNSARFQRGLEFYTKRFEHCRNATLVMDATPDYLDLAPQIRSFYDHWALTGSTQQLKILMILREPVSRELSLYNHLKKLHLEDPDPTQWYATLARDDGSLISFDEHVLEHLVPCYKGQRVFMYSCTTGGYARHLERWFDLFDRKTQILVVSYDELQDSPDTALARVERFLAADQKFDASLLTRENTQSSEAKVKHPSCVSQVRLSRVFAPWNENLYRLLEDHPGPAMEQRPFPKFHLGVCEAMKKTKNDRQV
jgi:hypothetical protein